MRKILTSLFILTTITLHACTCSIAGIKKSYTYSSAVFYGKYLSTDTVKGFNDISRRPFVVDNFEVSKFYRGVDSLTFQHSISKRKSYIISLINNSQDGCGISFEKEKMYLVYAYRDFYGGHLTTDGCTRTRQILSGNFIASFPSDPDKGKDEDFELNSLIRIGEIEKLLPDYDNAINLQNEFLKSQLVEVNTKLHSRTMLLYGITTASILIVILLLYRLRLQKKANNA
ncbi:MAG: hypothetical protein EAY81_10365 [Bacteroidetes bacterium]|nr:MAG: hypothetical protein EAY81_10365 [Bacteroidota bacterium]